ncbi:SprT family zinc-dependent metalloprotease [uncultured Helicobacter sp.]|uniref:M48 family metallopeptidase n=1 Tax=uncultured Helicobacter sp. TaxID=175537 RepID=UPI0026257321|nr:SprT family zinc-dependent metalloprotease [uncultured Helicobacter sp.]
MQEVKIVYKDIKNMILKVKPSLEVVLSVPKDASAKEIEYVLSKRKAWIEQRVQGFKKHIALPKELRSGEDIHYLGKRYRLKVVASDSESMGLRGGFLEVRLRDSKDFTRKQELIKAWYHKRAKRCFEEILEKYSSLLGCQTQKLRIKEMKTRWGSCNPKTPYINLNLKLIEKSKRAIEYVILHELIHLKYPYHNREFYDYLGLYMPDWRERKLRLLEGMQD